MKYKILTLSCLFTLFTFSANAEEVDMTQKTYNKSLKALEELDPLQYHITQENGTERPFDNKYWNNKEDGIYIDIVSGEPLFSSTHKFDSGSGWPSFTEPLNQDMVVKKSDKTLGTVRTEVRSKAGDSHLGHVFEDGPKDAGGMRYCINSASLKFIPKESLAKEGYEEYLILFK